MLVTSGVATAQEQSIHWAYASYFGTGQYSIDGRLETSVITFTPSWTWREPELTESGEKAIGFRFRFPISVGAYEFSSLGTVGNVRFESINAISVVPGVEIEIPMTDRWDLKALGFVGYGSKPGTGDAKIFRFGFRSRLVWNPGKTTISLVNGLERIGYSADSDTSNAINALSNGLDFSRNLESKQLGGRRVQLHWHVMHTQYLDRLGVDLSGLSIRPDSLSGEWELGAAFGREGERIGLGRLHFDRIGLAYRFSSDGDFSGVGIVLKSLFDR